MRLVVAEDFLLLREGLVQLLERAGFEVVGQAGDAVDLVRKVSSHKPDVALVDVRMPPTHTDDGLRAALEIRRREPGVGVLVLSAYIEETYAHELLADNAAGVGYLLKHRVTNLKRFAEAIRRVGEGGSALDPDVVTKILRRDCREDELAKLTERERKTLALMAEGRSNRGIAEDLVVTESAVEKYVSKVFAALDLSPGATEHRRVLAVLSYLRSTSD